MLRLFRHYVPTTILVLGMIEFVVIVAAAELAWRVRWVQLGQTVPALEERIAPIALFAIGLCAAMVAMGAYTIPALRSARYALTRLLAASMLAVLILSVLAFVLPGSVLWRSTTLYALVFATAILGVSRAIGSRMRFGGRLRRRIVVMGAGPRAARIAALAERPGAGFTIAAAIVMDPGEPVLRDAVPRATIDDLVAFLDEHDAVELVLAIEERRRSLPMDDLLRAKTTGVAITDIARFLERETGRIDLQTTRPSSLILSDGFSALRPYALATKRAFDLTMAAVLLALVAPVVALAAVAVRLESPGGAFYSQRRVGLYGRPYTIRKLRSMRADAEAAGAVWATERDPRVTRVGRFLRDTRIDELPQLWCILLGHMSFVGPRPERPEFVERLAETIPFYNERHMMKPGLTGWAQINYPYGASEEDARAKLEYDLYYTKNASVFLDLLILLQTVRVVLFPDGVR